ncbi:MAG TPA: LysR family transcriptional regulator [Magnetospirillum sp.]|jgi:DNA-binding transcriptional LysR family regulator|nr:LysR family transcriptional regulator [Magnetospirillum sp.]
MNWEDLRHFVVLARSGSLSEASRQLGVDHTTVARRVGALEAALGVRLVDRLPRAYCLTEDGRRIAALGEKLEDDAFAVLRAARAADPSPSGCVRVSAPPVFASTLLAPRLPILRTRHPGIVVELVGESRSADLDKREADLALRLSAPQGDSLVARKLGELTYGLYASPFFDGEPAFVAYDDSLDHVPQQAWLHRVAADQPIVFRANDVASLAAAARAGVGIAVLPDFLARGDSHLRKWPAPADLPPPRRSLWLVVHDDLRRSARIRAVMDFLAEAVAEGLAS